jgi:hypothetical protein
MGGGETTDQLRTMTAEFSAPQRSTMDTSEEWFPLDDRGPDLGVKGSRVQAGEAWDSLSLWKYAVQAASQEMTARSAGKAVGNAGLCRRGKRVWASRP